MIQLAEVKHNHCNKAARQDQFLKTRNIVGVNIGKHEIKPQKKKKKIETKKGKKKKKLKIKKK